MTIRCENVFCISWTEEGCIFDEIELDALGNCTNCILIELGAKEAEEKRFEIFIQQL